MCHCSQTIYLNLIWIFPQSDNEGSFDFAYVDADKINYPNYHERLLKLLKVGGVVVYDNTLWGGSVAMPEEHVAEKWRSNRDRVIEFNKLLASDSRIQICLAPLGDGMTICRKLIWNTSQIFLQHSEALQDLRVVNICWDMNVFSGSYELIWSIYIMYESFIK